jgi:general secretion pathway protein I
MPAARHPRFRAPRAQRFSGGFSLLEVLVAFVVFSLVATALFRLFSGALANASAADDYTRALLVAESVLDSRRGTPLTEGEDAGTADDGRIRWNSSVTRYDPPGVSADLAQASTMLPVRLYRVEIEVLFPSPSGGERRFTLSTVRLGANRQRS